MFGGRMIGYPKEKERRRRQRHKKSILQEKDGRCYLCCRLRGDERVKDIEEHHVFGGSRRKISEAEGLKVYLCPACHRNSTQAVHRNQQMTLYLQRIAQARWEETHTRAEWMALMGKNYREDGDDSGTA